MWCMFNNFNHYWPVYSNQINLDTATASYSPHTTGSSINFELRGTGLVQIREHCSIASCGSRSRSTFRWPAASIFPCTTHIIDIFVQHLRPRNSNVLTLRPVHDTFNRPSPWYSVDSIDPSLPHSLPPPPPLILVVNIAHPKASKPAASCFPSKATLQLDQPPALSPVDSLRRDITRTFSLIDGLRDYVQAFTYLVYDQRPHTPLQLADFDYW